MEEDQFTKLFKYMEKRFDSIEKQLEKKADSDDVKRILDLLDAMVKRQEITDDEVLVMGHQLNRMDQWVHELADKIGHKLEV